VNILIAEDDRPSSRLLEQILQKAGHDVVLAEDGAQAWQILQRDDAPRLALLDWQMPGLDGVTVCRQVRALSQTLPTYLIMVTGKDRLQDVTDAFHAGADDYVVKPYFEEELLLRLHVGIRALRLQEVLASRIRQLEDVLKRMRGAYDEAEAIRRMPIL
jgi:DNA-binding response OmpR family regulator